MTSQGQSGAALQQPATNPLNNSYVLSISGSRGITVIGLAVHSLPSIWRERDIEVALTVARMLFPTVVVGEETVRATDQYLSGDDVPGPIRRILIEGKDNMLRAMRGRALDAAAQPVPTTSRS